MKFSSFILPLLVLCSDFLPVSSFSLPNAGPQPHLPQTTLRAVRVTSAETQVAFSDMTAGSAHKYTNRAPQQVLSPPPRRRATWGDALAKASTLNSQRIAHVSLGTASLLLGVHHLVACFTHGWDMPISQSEVLLQGIVHTSCAIAGIPRLNMKSKVEWGRNHLILSTVPTNIWFTWTSLTEYTQGSDAMLPMFSNDMLTALTVVNTMFFFWILYIAWVAGSPDSKQQKTGTWYSNPLQSVIATFSVNIFWLLSEHLSFLRIQMAADPDSYTAFVQAYPEFTHAMTNIHVDSMFVNNLAVFAVTLMKYKAFRNKDVLYVGGTAGLVFAAITNLIDGGNEGLFEYFSLLQL